MHHLVAAIVLLVAAVLLPACAGPGAHDTAPAGLGTGVLFGSVTIEGVERKYALYVPRDYTPDKPWPCAVFLNGSGECGSDGQRQLTQGLLPAILNAPQDWPMIVVFPQKPSSTTAWLDDEALVLASLEATRAKYTIDPRRVYLTGLSRGGAGTWAIGARHPELFAALVPVCGYGEPGDVAPGAARLPVWTFHGQKDSVVPAGKTLAIVDAVKAAGGNVRLTLYPDLDHGCWDRAYRDADLPEWMLEQRRAR